MFLFSVKKTRVWIIASWGAPYMVFIGPVFHCTTKTCLKRVHDGDEWVEKEICLFVEDMRQIFYDTCLHAVKKEISRFAENMS